MLHMKESRKLKRLGKIYGIFAPHLKPYWRWFLFGYMALIGAVFMNLLKPWPLKIILDYIILDNPMPESLQYLTALIGPAKQTLLTIFAISIVLVYFCEGLFSFTQKYYLAGAGENTINDIRRRVFHHLQILPLGAGHSGDIIVRLTSDINSLKNLLVRYVQSFTKNVFTFISITITMFWMDWQLTLAALSVVPPLYFLSFYFAGRVETLARKKRTKESEIASIVQETMISKAVVQAFSQEEAEKKRFAKESEESLEASLEKMRLAKGFSRSLQVIVALGTATVTWYGAMRVLGGMATPGDLIVFISYLGTLYKPVSGLSELTLNVTSSLVCGERIVDILETEVRVIDRPDAIEAPAFHGEVIFENVTFGYMKEKPVLQNLSFTIKPGQMAVLVGSSGTGKSTIANLLLRFFDPSEGRILIDGQDIRDLKLESIRQQMSVVLQEPILFRRTIRENISYGNPEVCFEEVVKASKAAQAHEFIIAQQNGYETMLEERGQNLSGGQKQRIALARAILRKAPILILDEPVTGIDAITETHILDTLGHLMRGRTTLMIAHRLLTIQKADLILLVEVGRVVEQGTHEELLDKSSLYRNLYTLQ